jgi:MraZ protein
MFLGEYEASLDAKNRVSFPAKLRDKIPEAERRSLILLPHPDGCLVLYTPPEWERIARESDERSRSNPSYNPNDDRAVYPKAVDVDIDGVGRILIPEKLKREAGLKKIVVFAGVRNRIELWDQERYVAQEEERNKRYMQVGKNILK